MSTASSLQLTWKRMAEEREGTTRNLARVAIGLLVACNVLAFASYSGRARDAASSRHLDSLNPSAACYVGSDVVSSPDAVRTQCQ